MRKYLIAVLAALLVGALFPTGAFARGDDGDGGKVAICHRKSRPGEFKLKRVSQNAVAGHLGHGDGLPGGPVPGMESLKFDETCVPRTVLESVLARGALRCGISGEAFGFSLETAPGVFEGMDVDMCRVVAAAVLGDADAVEFVPLNAAIRFQALHDGTVDVLMRNTTDTLSRDAAEPNDGVGVNFGPTYFYDGQGILVDRSGPGLGALTVDSTIADFPDGTTVCLPPEGTTTRANILDAAAAAGVSLTPITVFSFVPEAVDNLIDGVCEVVSTDRSGLAGIRSLFVDVFELPDAVDWLVLKQTLAKEPLAPVVLDGDDEWMAIVRWTVFATFFAEEVGITRSNIDDPGRRDSRSDISLAFGADADITGTLLGLDAEWAYRVIKQVGNYGEIYDAHLPAVGLPRAGTLNDSYLDGGLIYSAPLR